MCDFDESFARLASHALRRGIWSDQVWILGFELLQFVDQAVEFRVADLRIIEHVIAVLVMPNLLAQRFNLCCHGLGASLHAKFISPQSHRATENARAQNATTLGWRIIEINGFAYSVPLW